jgi:hypothetical protein
MGRLEPTESFNLAKIGSVLDNLLPLKRLVGQVRPVRSVRWTGGAIAIQSLKLCIVEEVDEQQDSRETADAGEIERALR